MNKLLLPATAVVFAFSMAFAEEPKVGEVSAECFEEIADLPVTKENFNFSAFPKELAVSAVKVQGSCKTPVLKAFLCPANDKITDVGLTAGCVKELPTDPGPLKSLLIKVGFEMVKGIVADKLGVERKRVPSELNKLVDFALNLSIEKASVALDIKPEETPKNMKDLEALLSKSIKDKSVKGRNLKEAENILNVLSTLSAFSALNNGGSSEDEKKPNAPAEKVADKDISDNLRTSIYLHPPTLIVSVPMEEIPLMLYATLEFPSSGSNSIIINPSVWKGKVTAGALGNTGIEIFRLASGIGIRHFPSGNSEGFYLQLMPSLHYYAITEILDYGHSINSGDWCTDSRGCEDDYTGYFFDILGYIGYSAKYSSLRFFMDIGLGYGWSNLPKNIMSVNGDRNFGLSPDINLGIGWAF